MQVTPSCRCSLRQCAVSIVDVCVWMQAYASQWDTLHSRLICASKSLERQLQSCTSSEQPALQQQMSSLPTAMQSVATRQQMVLDKLAADIAAAAAVLDAAVSRLQMELSSGGNIRLEEGKHSDSWFASCQELLKSKLIQTSDSGGGLGIDDIQVGNGRCSCSCMCILLLPGHQLL